LAMPLLGALDEEQTCRPVFNRPPDELLSPETHPKEEAFTWP
jgi:hypothetical protein